MSNVPKVLVTRRQFKDQINRLAEVSEVIHLERPSPPSRTELKRYVENCAGIFAHITDSIDAEIMDAAGKNLKIIAEFGVGYDNINVVDASNRNIAVATEAMAQAVGGDAGHRPSLARPGLVFGMGSLP